MYRVGIVGAAGRIASRLEDDPLRSKPASHLGAYKFLSKLFDVVAVCDVNVEKVRQVAQRFQVPYYFKDVKEMLDKVDLDVVSVCTPPDGRFEVICSLAEYPKRPKLIFTEKPIEANLYEAEAIKEVCQKNGVKLMVNHTRRFSYAFKSLWYDVNFNKFGRLLLFRGLFSGDVVSDGVHMADLVNWFSTEETAISVENVKTPYLLFEVDLIFSEARVMIRDNGARFELYRPKESKRYQNIEELELVEVLPYKFSFSEAMLNALKEIDYCLRLNREPSCGADEGIEALRLALKWREKFGKKKVKLDSGSPLLQLHSAERKHS